MKMNDIKSETLSETIDLLTKDNYKTWRMKAEALLDVSSLWEYVNGDKKLSSEDAVVDQELWKMKDKRAKSTLILHISSALLALVEDCETSREIWLKLENIYADKRENSNHSIDEDVIIYNIETIVDELLETIINDSSEDIVASDKKSLSFADDLFLRLTENGLKKLPGKKIVADIVAVFIINVIRKLSKTEIKEQKNELSGELIDDLLVTFDINPHKNNNDEATDNVDVANVSYNTVHNREKEEDNSIQTQRQILRSATESLAEIAREIANNNRYVYRPQYDCGEIQLGDSNSVCAPLNLYTPPLTPSPRKTYKCGICREKGHNRTTCPLNKPAAPLTKSVRTTTTPLKSQLLNKPVTSTPKSAAKEAVTPKRSYKCGICGEEGHNRTTCSLNKSESSAIESFDSGFTPTPKRSYKCGACGIEGHNKTSCPSMKSNTPTPKREAFSTPVRSYTCGLCGGEGHNRSTCSRNSVSSTASTKTTYSCGTCGGQGHNSRTCSAGRRSAPAPSYFVSSFSYSPPSYSYRSSPSSYSGGGGRRSYTCGNCGGSGHNRRTCSG